MLSLTMSYTICGPDARATYSSQCDCTIRLETYPDGKGLLLCINTRGWCRYMWRLSVQDSHASLHSSRSERATLQKLLMSCKKWLW